MAFIRTKEQASPFTASQTVAQVATRITTYLGVTVTVSNVLAQMTLRSRPGAAAGTQVSFSEAEILLNVFQEQVIP